MNGHYTYTPYIWLPVFTVLLLIALAVYSGDAATCRRVPFSRLSVCGAWATGSVMEYAAVVWKPKSSGKVPGVWQLPVVTAIICFVLEYTWPGRWFTRRNLTLLSFPCLLVLGLILTNDLHHLAWRGFAFDESILPQCSDRAVGSPCLYLWLGNYKSGHLCLVIPAFAISPLAGGPHVVGQFGGPQSTCWNGPVSSIPSCPLTCWGWHLSS